MPHADHGEWPSFDAVLQEVVPEDVAKRLRPESRSKRRPRPAVDPAIERTVEGADELIESSALTDTLSSVRATLDSSPRASAPHEVSEPIVFDPDAEPVELEMESVTLPSPLPPLDLDTSRVRDLLSPSSEPEVELDLSALEELEPIEALEPLPDPDPVVETDVQVEDDEPNVFVLTDLDGYEFDESSDDRSLASDELFADISAPVVPEPFELDPSLDPLAGITLGEPEPLPDAEPDAVIVLDEPDLAETHSDEGDEHGDDQAEDDSVVLDLFGEDSWDTTSFDSVATADAIEDDLNEISSENLGDNVIPLYQSNETPNVPLYGPAESDDTHQESQAANFGLTELDDFGSMSEVGTAWSDGAEAAPDEELDETPQVQANRAVWKAVEGGEKRDDPWAYMRPDEEPTKKGWWANRPKFFGGDTRKQAKAARRAAEQEVVDEAVNVSFDDRCPDCNREVMVDLDDPIGRRVHVSCSACNTYWHTPYIVNGEAVQTEAS